MMRSLLGKWARSGRPWIIYGKRNGHNATVTRGFDTILG
jgi:hypothetical protein